MTACFCKDSHRGAEDASSCSKGRVVGVPDSIMDQWWTHRHYIVIQGHRKTDGWMDGHWTDPLTSI